jgi:hypothetical protein
MSSNISSGTLTLRTDLTFNGVKVFSATMVADREHLGEKITSWLAAHPSYKLTDVIVTQSSDEAFHCVAITVFYFEEPRR